MMTAPTSLRIDCHVHILDPQRFPYVPDTAYAPAGAEIATREQLGHVLDYHGVAHALIVGPNSGYGFDNRCLLDALAHGAGRYKGIAVVRNDATLDELRALKTAGVVGVALNPALLGVAAYLDAAPLLANLRELDLWVQVQVRDEQLIELRPLLEASGAKLLIDHCGRPNVAAGLNQAGFQALLAMASTGRTVVKLSGYAKICAQPYPYEDMRPFVQALLATYTPQALVWASDWPFLRAPERLDYGPQLALLERWVPHAPARQAILWDTPVRIFGFAH
jgi:predicted TIM-barrel fold metal-dependent hydrolase